MPVRFTGGPRMPQLITYDSRPVKRRRRVARGLLLIFYAPQPGQAGDQLVVTDEQWNRHGQVRYFQPGMRPDIRAAARGA